MLTAQYWGAKDIPAVRKVTTLMLLASLFFAASLAIPELIMQMYASDPEVIAAGAVYLRIVAPTFLLTGPSQTLIIVLRSVREMKLPLVVSGISFVTNLLFNWVLIFGQFGLPRMEIRGAALATVLARLIETGVIVWFVFSRDARIGLKLCHLVEPCGQYLPRYLKYSAPVILSGFLLGLGNTAVTMIIAHLSASFVAANSIVAMTVRLSTVMNQGFATAGSIMTGDTLGQASQSWRTSRASPS